jgi:hypothetical protein
MTIVKASRLSRSEMSILGNNVSLAVSRDRNEQMHSRSLAGAQDSTEQTPVRLSAQHDAGIPALSN